MAEYLCDGVVQLPGETLTEELGAWLATSSRFLAFAEANRDKIRKKLRTATEPGARGDVRAELETAFRLLADRRIDLVFEAYGSGQRGPDFTVVFRASHRFNLEVTRPRSETGEAEARGAIGNAVIGKLRQLPADSPNALLLAAGLGGSASEVAAAMKALKLAADHGDEASFARKGLAVDEVRAYYRRLGLLIIGNRAGPGVHVWANPETSRRLPEGATNALTAALAPARWGENHPALRT